MVKAVAGGLQVGHTPTHVFAAADYLYPYSFQLTVGVAGLSAARTDAHAYGDWTATAQWDDGAAGRWRRPSVTGCPTCSSSIERRRRGRHAGRRLRAPGTTRTACSASPSRAATTASSRRRDPRGAAFGSPAVVAQRPGLPVDRAPARQRRSQHARALPSRTPTPSSPTAGSTGCTTRPTAIGADDLHLHDRSLKESNGTSVNETMTALYRHQWLNTSDAAHRLLLSVGERRDEALRGAVRSRRTYQFHGVLPALPDRGDYNPAELLALVQAVATETLPVGPTYDNGKAMAPLRAPRAHRGPARRHVTERDHFLAEIKTRLEDWFTVGGARSTRTSPTGTSSPAIRRASARTTRSTTTTSTRPTRS